MKNKQKKQMRYVFASLWITFFIILAVPGFALGYGGGGGSYSQTIPGTTSSSLTINQDATSTNLNVVNLTASASNAYQMAISNTADFLNVSWESYATSKTWTLTTGSGTRTVYIKFRSSDGGVSQVISKNITLTTTNLLNQPDLNGDGKVNDFDFSIIMSNWGTPKNAVSSCHAPSLSGHPLQP